ncbi:MAG: FAD-dependent oxidoreductase [Candidatus Peregrinibacteria bacterium]|nr:FAD-dependent oxidoreductase [Candidatus Peregrinibacteria bacterium]MCB9808669.1 FAD-dependent oxidoreductase [Candidatus Peribacteria bacterium]
MSTPRFSVTCTRKELIAENIYEVAFAKPEGFSFTAGQFVLFDVPLLDNPEDIQPRAYSIGSAPKDDELVFAIKSVPNGRMTLFLENKMQKGTQLSLQGALGNFLLDRTTPKDYVFLCTATGIAPFRSYLRSYLAEETDRKIDLFFGLLRENELFWEDELKEFQKQYQHFNYYICINRFVQDEAMSAISDFSNKQIYLCGSPLMTKAVKEIAISQWHVPKADVHMEGFI